MEERKKMGELFQRYLDNDCTPGEIKTLLAFFGKEKNEEQLRMLIREHLQTGANEEALPQSLDDQFIENVFSDIKKALHRNDNKVVPLYRKNWFRVAAAACFVLALSSSAYFLFRTPQQLPVAQNEKHIETIKDIPPGRNSAILTLYDGTKISLDLAANGTLAKQGNASVLKIGGRIAYEQEGAKGKSAPLIWNTIRTANANQYQLVLSDGTKVWLNAASSIRFPASFSSDERKVEITGEVYFEVAKDARKRFKVEFSDQAGQKAEIEVFGTHFNVNTYLDEPEMRTTLLEGSVKISEASQSQMLTPGQQAILSSNGIRIKEKADLDQVMAWRNGYFLFNNTDIYTLMRQVARWYNIEVAYEGQISKDGFSGKISRDVPLSQFIKILEFNDIQVKREGNRKIILTHGASKQI